MVHLSERVQLHTKAHIADEEGGVQTSWATLGEYWAHLKLLAPRRRTESPQECGKHLEKPCFMITLRKQVPLRGNMRLTWRGCAYQLISYPVIEPTRQWVRALIQPLGGPQ